MEQYRPFYF